MLLFGSPFAFGYAVHVCRLSSWLVTSIVAMVISGLLTLLMLVLVLLNVATTL